MTRKRVGMWWLLALIAIAVAAACQPTPAGEGGETSEPEPDAAGAAAASAEEDSPYHAEIQTWREDREDRLKADDGWLTVAGLYWLRDGENRVGTANTNDFILPEGSAPEEVGVFSFEAGKTTFQAREGVEVRQKGEPVTTAALEATLSDDAIEIGSLRMWVHKSGDRFAIRLRDQNSPFRLEFTGLKWFPVDPAYQVTARFEPYDRPREVELLNILGDVERYESPGVVHFELEGEAVSLQGIASREDRLWFVFRDGTSGKETYPSARFLYSDDAPSADGKVTIDFNKAYNPPCAFNPHTTCPLPVKENRLAVRIEAGEKSYGKHPAS